MSAIKLPYIIEASGLSDVGLLRDNNEDVWAELPEVPLFALADGMGGHKAGEIASAESVLALCDIFEQELTYKNHQISFEEAYDLLKNAILQVNRYVHKMGCRSRSLEGMGTTLCALYFHKEGLTYGHVGDSRIYRLREGKLNLLTEDHSLMREMIERGKKLLKKPSSYKNVITRAIGAAPKVSPTLSQTKVQEGDVYMMCSDGLSDLIKSEEMEVIMNEAENLKEANRQLISFAKHKGGHDNITVVLTKVCKKP